MRLTMIPKEAKPKLKHNKKKKTKGAPPLSFSSLPDEITENIHARLSKWSYPNLSLVSKRFLSIVSSPDLYATRSRIGTTEPCLYLCLEDSPNIPSPQWFTLWMKPADETLTHNNNDILHDYSLVPLPSCPNPHHVHYSSTVFVGSDIYLIGGTSNGPPSSLVNILDCRSHTWRDGPSMSVARAGVTAYLIHGKIYVMEKNRKDDNWMEVLDVKTQSWSPLLSRGAAEFRSDWFMIRVFRGKIYAVANKHYAYEPDQGTWEVVKKPKKFRYKDGNAAWCVIKDVSYSYTTDGFFKWYDRDMNRWTNVKGSDLELFSTHSEYSFAEGCVLTICNHGEKLLVMWVPRFEEYNGKHESRICCAKIAVEKCHGNEVWGKIEWVNEVLTVTSSYKFLSCVVNWI